MRMLFLLFVRWCVGFVLVVAVAIIVTVTEEQRGYLIQRGNGNTTLRTEQNVGGGGGRVVVECGVQHGPHYTNVVPFRFVGDRRGFGSDPGGLDFVGVFRVYE